MVYIIIWYSCNFWPIVNDVSLFSRPSHIMVTRHFFSLGLSLRVGLCVYAQYAAVTRIWKKLVRIAAGTHHLQQVQQKSMWTDWPPEKLLLKFIKYETILKKKNIKKIWTPCHLFTQTSDCYLPLLVYCLWSQYTQQELPEDWTSGMMLDKRLRTPKTADFPKPSLKTNILSCYTAFHLLPHLYAWRN